MKVSDEGLIMAAPAQEAQPKETGETVRGATTSGLQEEIVQRAAEKQKRKCSFLPSPS